MKVITLKKKNILKTILISLFAIIICKYTTAFGMQHWTNNGLQALKIDSEVQSMVLLLIC